jgi:hypothetical protein
MKFSFLLTSQFNANGHFRRTTLLQEVTWGSKQGYKLLSFVMPRSSMLACGGHRRRENRSFRVLERLSNAWCEPIFMVFVTFKMLQKKSLGLESEDCFKQTSI